MVHFMASMTAQKPYYSGATVPSVFIFSVIKFLRERIKPCLRRLKSLCVQEDLKFAVATFVIISIEGQPTVLNHCRSAQLKHCRLASHLALALNTQCS